MDGCMVRKPGERPRQQNSSIDKQVSEEDPRDKIEWEMKTYGKQQKRLSKNLTEKKMDMVSDHPPPLGQNTLGHNIVRLLCCVGQNPSSDHLLSVSRGSVVQQQIRRGYDLGVVLS